jgi:hypothetical protein
MLKVSFISGGPAPAVIFDETKPWPPDWCHEGFCPRPQRQFQNTPVMRGANPFMADRFNMYGKWEVTVTHTFATAQACQDFIGNRPAIQRTGEVQILFAFAGATWMRYYKSCFLTQVEPVKVFPISCDYRYALLLNSLFSITP